MSNSVASGSNSTGLYDELRKLASSGNSQDLQVLASKLSDPAVLGRLDDAEAYNGPADRLRIAGVLHAVGTNQTPAARSLLNWLTTSQPFIKEAARIELLIRLLADIRPPSAEALAFWQRYSQPDDGFSNVTVSALIRNGTPEALTLFAQIIENPGHPEEDRFSWLVLDVLTHRNDLALLQVCERLVAGSMDESDRLLLVDVLFDYQPEEWYRPAAWPEPPSRSSASKEALQVLERIGRWSLSNMPLGDDQRRVVEEVVGDIGS